MERNNLEQNKHLVANFIEAIWNKGRFDELGAYIHPDFVDHSLPAAFAADVEGLKRWITATGQSFEHRSLIEAQVTEGDRSMIKIRMFLKHIGPWRGIEPTGVEITTVGYRYFRLVGGRIIEHWALLDGNAIENQLKESASGCKIQA